MNIPGNTDTDYHQQAGILPVKTGLDTLRLSRRIIVAGENPFDSSPNTLDSAS